MVTMLMNSYFISLTIRNLTIIFGHPSCYYLYLKCPKFLHSNNRFICSFTCKLINFSIKFFTRNSNSCILFLIKEVYMLLQMNLFHNFYIIHQFLSHYALKIKNKIIVCVEHVKTPNRTVRFGGFHYFSEWNSKVMVE